jgi:fibronectin type III domain protein
MHETRGLRVGVIGLLLLAALVAGCDDQDTPSPSTVIASLPSSPCTSARLERAYLEQPNTVATPTVACGPRISGTPATTVMADSAFSFRPTVRFVGDAELTFSIVNPPSWATFDTTTGQLTGTPTAADVGTYNDILITVTSGGMIASLPSFSITVSQIATGSVTLSWTAPYTNTNGTPVTNLAGYRIVYGTSLAALTQSVTIPGQGLTNYVIDNLTPGTWYFAIASYNSDGTESALTPIVSTTI